MSPVTTALSSPHHRHQPHHPRSLFLPTSHPCYGRQGPRKQSWAPSGEFPLHSALYLLTTHPITLPLTAGPGECPPGQSQGAPPTSRHVGCVDPTMHTSLQTRREPAHPVPRQKRPPPLRQPPLATLILWLTAHENAHETTRRPTKPPIYSRQQPSTQDNHPRRRN